MNEFGINSVEGIALALDGVRAGQGKWRCLCPVHGGHSLSIAEGRDGCLLCHCFGAGCSFSEISAALREMGLSTGGAPRSYDNFTFGACSNPEGRERAGEIYRQTRPAAGSPVEAYLRGRGIALAVPAT